MIALDQGSGRGDNVHPEYLDPSKSGSKGGTNGHQSTGRKMTEETICKPSRLTGHGNVSNPNGSSAPAAHDCTWASACFSRSAWPDSAVIESTRLSPLWAHIVPTPPYAPLSETDPVTGYSL